MILSIPFAFIGLLVGGVINVLADDLPMRVKPRLPHCPRCQHEYGITGWLALGRKLLGGKCPNCGLDDRPREFVVESFTIALFALLPWLISPLSDLIIYSFYIGVLILVTVIDLEHRLVLHIVTFPTTIFAILASFFLTETTVRLSILGLLTGFIIFFILYLLGQRVFGYGALGFGDVTLAAMLGAMLGFQLIFFALILGVLLAGIWALIAFIARRASLRTHFAYGPFLAISGIIMILFGAQIYSLFLIT